MNSLIYCKICDFVASNQITLNSHAFSRHCQCVLCGNIFNSTLELISHKKSEHHKNRGNVSVSKSVDPDPVQMNAESKNIEDQKNCENVRVSKSTVDPAPVQKNAEAEYKNIEDQKSRENVGVSKSTVDHAPVQNKAEAESKNIEDQKNLENVGVPKSTVQKNSESKNIDDQERKHAKIGTERKRLDEIFQNEEHKPTSNVKKITEIRNTEITKGKISKAGIKRKRQDERSEKDLSEGSKPTSKVQKITDLRNTEIDKDEISKGGLKRKRQDEMCEEDFSEERKKCEKDISEENKSIFIVQKIAEVKNNGIDKGNIMKTKIKSKRPDEMCKEDLSEKSKSISIVQKIAEFKKTEIDKENFSKAAIKRKRREEDSVKEFVKESKPVQTCLSNNIELLTKEAVRNRKLVDPEIAKSGEGKNSKAGVKSKRQTENSGKELLKEKESLQTCLSRLCLKLTVDPAPVQKNAETESITIEDHEIEHPKMEIKHKIQNEKSEKKSLQTCSPRNTKPVLKVRKMARESLISSNAIPSISMFHCINVDCNFSSNSLDILSDHQDNFCIAKKSKGTNQRLKFACEHCEFTCKDSKNYSRHIRQVHIVIKDKRYKCDECNFSTSEKYALIIHIDEDKCCTGDLFLVLHVKVI